SLAQSGPKGPKHHRMLPFTSLAAATNNQLTRNIPLILPVNAHDAVTTLAAYLAEEDREHFVVLLLNSKNCLIGINTVSIGSLTSSLAHPREVFKRRILANAAAIIVAHNHPSGEPTPSYDDVEITKRLQAGADLLGIRL